MLHAFQHYDIYVPYDNEQQNKLDYIQFLPEVDVLTGGTFGEISFDLLGTKLESNTTASMFHVPNPKASSCENSRLYQTAAPLGRQYLAAIYHGRYLVIWDLDNLLLHAVKELDDTKSKKYIALAASLCDDHWIFYAAEGSQRIKVTSLSASDNKTISLKLLSRTNQITILQYSTPHRLLCSGWIDGSFQLLQFSSSNGISDKTESALTTLICISPPTSIPIVQLSFAVHYASGQHDYLLIGYENCTIDIWSTTPNQAQGQRFASTQVFQQTVYDFKQSHGTLSLQYNTEKDCLAIHWCSYRNKSHVCIWHFNSSPSLDHNLEAHIEWHDLILPECSQDIKPIGYVIQDEPLVAHVGLNAIGTLSTGFVAYTEMLFSDCDILVNLRVKSSAKISPQVLSTIVQMNLEDYHSGGAQRDSVLQFVYEPCDKATNNATYAIKLQRFSFQTGATDVLSTLSEWMYHGVLLHPREIRWSICQRAIAVKLSSTTMKNYDVAGHGFYFALIYLDEMNEKLSSQENGDIIMAQDICFGNATESNTLRLQVTTLVLDTSGMLLSSYNDNTLPISIQLGMAMERISITDLPLVNDSPYKQNVGSRLLYISRKEDVNQPQYLILSDDYYLKPIRSSCIWTTSANEILETYKWNSSEITNDKSDRSLTATLLAVLTNHRLVILDKDLIVVHEFMINGVEGCFIYWVAQTLVYSTTCGQIRYVSPLRCKHYASSSSLVDESSLLLSLSEIPYYTLVSSNISIINIGSDRICYALIDKENEIHNITRPLSICELIISGYPYDITNPKQRQHLKMLFTQKWLEYVQLSSQGIALVYPWSDRLLKMMVLEYNWAADIAQLLLSMESPTAQLSTRIGANSNTQLLSFHSVALVFVYSGHWSELLKIFAREDPLLQETLQTLVNQGSSRECTAKLPSSMSPLRDIFIDIGRIMKILGQDHLAYISWDVAGEDLLLINDFLNWEPVVSPAAKYQIWKEVKSCIRSRMLVELQSVNLPLAALASIGGYDVQTLQDSIISPRDLFLRRCSNVIVQSDRRSRLLYTEGNERPQSTVQCDRLCMAQDSFDEKAYTKTNYNDKPGYLRLVIGDISEWIGSSLRVNRMPVHSSQVECETVSREKQVQAIGLEIQDDHTNINSIAKGDVIRASIGPFLEEEDAVVAYWRFQEGNSVDMTNENFVCADLSPRGNNLLIDGLGANENALQLVISTSPVDPGDENRVQIPFAVCFPRSYVKTFSIKSCSTGNQPDTLNIGIEYHEDTYRRQLTIEFWARNTEIACDQDRQKSIIPAIGSQSIIARKLNEHVNQNVWELSIVRCPENSFLQLNYYEHCIDTKLSGETSEQLVGGNWLHIAFSVHVKSQSEAELCLFVNSEMIVRKQVSLDPKLVAQGKTTSSIISIGEPDLCAFELTEIRVWAICRTCTQLSDMKENYLVLAETKRRMKVAIHPRDCTCEKCKQRKSDRKLPLLPPGPGKSTVGISSLAPPPAPSSRDRRRK